MRDDAATGPLTPASAPISGSPRNRQIPRGESAPARLGREDPRNFGSGTLTQLQHQSCGCEGGRFLQLTSHILGPQIGVFGPGSLAETEIGSAVHNG